MLINELTGTTDETNPALRNLGMAEFVASFPLSKYAQFYTMRGNADSPRKADAVITAGANRIIDDGYTAKKGTPGFGAIALKIYGDLVQTDQANQRRGNDIGSQRTRDLANFARSFGRYFMNAVINDELSVSKFSGLKEQATALALKSVFDGTNGGSLPTGNASADRKQQDKFLELLSFEVGRTRPTVIVANASFISRLESVGRSYLSTVNVKDIYGIEHVVTTYKNVPIVDAGFTANNLGYVIPTDEHEGTSTDCTSLYLIRYGEEMDVTMATNTGIDVKDLGLVGTQYQTSMEGDFDQAILDATALRRISGIRLSAA